MTVRLANFIAATALTPGDVFYITQGGVEKQLPASILADSISLPLTAPTGSSLVGFIQSGAGTVARTLQDKARESVSVLDFGAVLNSTSSGAINTAALAAAYLVNPNIYIPAGTLTLASNTPLPIGMKLYGAGSGVTTVQAPADMFVMSSPDSGDVGPTFKDITFQSVTTNGKLFTFATGSDLATVRFERCNFGAATYHIYATDLCVAHSFDSCRFVGATVCSRFYKGLWAHNETKCYTWFNAIGLQVSGSSSSTCTIVGSVFEYNTSVAVALFANGGDILGWSFVGCHFEGNGSASGAPDVFLQTLTANKIRGIMFEDCGWFSPNAASVVRVQSTASGGGNITSISFRGGQVNGTNTGAAGSPYLCTASSGTIIEPTVSFQAGGAPAGCSTLVSGLQTPVNGSIANFGGTGITSSYQGSGNSGINTVSYGAGNGGALCIVRGTNSGTGVSWVRILIVAIQTAGGATPVAATQIGTIGDASASVAITGSGGFVVVTVSGLASGGYWGASFIGL